jgi:hypothetical protein
MSDLFQLPDGRLVRRGQAFTLEQTLDVVIPAAVTTLPDGNQTILEPARVEPSKRVRQFPANWLGMADAAALEGFGIVPIEEAPDPDPQFFAVSPNEPRDGKLTKTVKDRPIEGLRDWLARETKAQAGALIREHYPLEDQQNDTVFDLERVGEQPNSADEIELTAIRTRRKWLRAVLSYKDDLIVDIEKLKTAADAKAWREAPAEWPVFPGTEEPGKVKAPKTTRVR